MYLAGERWKKIFALRNLRPGHTRLLSFVRRSSLATMMSKRGEQPCSSAGLRRRSVVLLLLCVVMVTGQVMNNDKKCLATGGMCVEENLCPAESRATEGGLCQGGETPGVCCYVTPNDANCQQRGGRCGNNNECANVQVFGQLDCPQGTECCLLIY
ncbi:uncharacterized protein TNIN_173451 [Trichonephila inaurata madagascariensis]|uniref:Uncharacterized protein n=1 Tax=Trichonephila inaurata madagascariensis TaxID=2747483 RepID=A0A8X6YSS2_9ARAC|nr:uncharacterized protein TNIN_173451 [Trichonephila inaurata madagascariensis]